ncbi:MAG: crossover junction endodeoxyribonuclease RuvC [Ruminococcaceae bacterium]|jgi:crossover junction endodeoxyribonuclease RuvC|nr:crossover junction endodeoxyribonuclease RuvC [Oscillospiraceae bacterium]
MVILGIDPGIAIVGWGVIESFGVGKKLRPVDYGAITTPSTMTTEDRLWEVHRELSAVIKTYCPEAASIEELFFNSNQKTGIIVAEARGVLLLACRQGGVPIYEYTPLQIKGAVAGYGRADKQQVIRMVTTFLGLKEPPKPDDTADALAAAICHSFTGTSKLAEYYNRPTTMAGKIGQEGKGSRAVWASKLGNENAALLARIERIEERRQAEQSGGESAD